jgi:hypothetical protein
VPVYQRFTGLLRLLPNTLASFPALSNLYSNEVGVKTMSPAISEREEYFTIIAPTAAQAMAQFKQRRLAEQGYAIASKIGRHQFTLVGEEGSADMFSGTGMIAATFSRKVTA